ncbi:MAG: hypothetical protein WC497_02775 [Patescibacteria group bacterium]
MLKKVLTIVLGVIGFSTIGYGFFKPDIKGNDPIYFASFVAIVLVTLLQAWPTRKVDKKNNVSSLPQ